MTRPLTTVTKPSKLLAYQIACRLREGNDITDLEKDLLVLYLATSTSAKTDDQWVARACAGEDHKRLPLRYVWVKDGVATGADGHRIHRAPTKLSEGFYHPHTLLPVHTDGMKYPSVDKFFEPKGCVRISRESLEPLGSNYWAIPDTLGKHGVDVKSMKQVGPTKGDLYYRPHILFYKGRRSWCISITSFGV